MKAVPDLWQVKGDVRNFHWVFLVIRFKGQEKGHHPRSVASKRGKEIWNLTQVKKGIR